MGSAAREALDLEVLYMKSRGGAAVERRPSADELLPVPDVVDTMQTSDWLAAQRWSERWRYVGQ